jgi:hypothetical protein
MEPQRGRRVVEHHKALILNGLIGFARISITLLLGCSCSTAKSHTGRHRKQIFPGGATSPAADGGGIDGYHLVLSRRCHAGNLRSAGWLRLSTLALVPSKCSSRELLRTSPGDRQYWPAVGRQRSMAARRRRHALFRVSRTLRQRLQRLLSATDVRALAADPTAPHPWNSANHI